MSGYLGDLSPSQEEALKEVIIKRNKQQQQKSYSALHLLCLFFIEKKQKSLVSLINSLEFFFFSFFNVLFVWNILIMCTLKAGFLCFVLVMGVRALA